MIMEKYLYPENNIPFKRIFGEHSELLKNFLCTLIIKNI
jgi:hypothetical protein